MCGVKYKVGCFNRSCWANVGPKCFSIYITKIHVQPHVCNGFILKATCQNFVFTIAPCVSIAPTWAQLRHITPPTVGNKSVWGDRNCVAVYSVWVCFGVWGTKLTSYMFLLHHEQQQHAYSRDEARGYQQQQLLRRLFVRQHFKHMLRFDPHWLIGKIHNYRCPRRSEAQGWSN